LTGRRVDDTLLSRVTSYPSRRSPLQQRRHVGEAVDDVVRRDVVVSERRLVVDAVRTRAVVISARSPSAIAVSMRPPPGWAVRP
jgi:hypothetical protein